MSSFGEAVTPVSRDREILGNCILGFDERGKEYVPWIEQKVSAHKLFKINGNLLNDDWSSNSKKYEDFYPQRYENLLIISEIKYEIDKYL